MNEIIEENKTKLIIIGILVVLTIIFFIISRTSNTKKYVYTKETNGNFKLPYLNIKGDNVKAFNEMIKEDYNETIKIGYNSGYDYEYYVKDKVIYLLIKKDIQKDDDIIIENEYQGYYYSLKLKRFLTNDEVLEKYNVNKSDVEKKVENHIKKQYDYESKEGYIVYQECNLECFKQLKGYTSVDDNVVYFANKKGLYAYLNVYNNSIYYTYDIHPKMNKKIKLN